MNLKVGDRVRITSLPESYAADEAKIFQHLVMKQRTVRIYWIDRYGRPWYRIRFKESDGKLEDHSIPILSSDTNWVLVQSRK